MKKDVHAVLAALVAAGAAVVVLASAAVASATTSVQVDFGNCAFGNNGVATAPAGVPITLTDTGAGAAGNYGTALHAYQSSVDTATIAVTGGATTTIPLAGSFPQYLGDPFFAWLTFLPDISLDPLAPGNVTYLLWMIMGYRLVQAVLVVTLGRLGDMFGRVRIYNAGFAVFTAASVLLSFDPFQGYAERCG